MPVMLQSMWQSRYLAVFVCDLQGRVLHVNDAGCGLLGQARASLLNVSIYDVVANSSQLYHDHQQLLTYAKAEKSTAEIVKVMSAREASSRSQQGLWLIDAEDVSEAEVVLELTTSRGILSTEAEVTCYQTAAGGVFLTHLIPVPTDQRHQPLRRPSTVSRSVTPVTHSSQLTPTPNDAEASADYYTGLRRWLDTVPEIFNTLLPGAVVILDRDGVYHDARNAPDYVANVPADQCIGKTLEQVLAPELVPERRRALEHVFRSKQPYTFVTSAATASGVRYYRAQYSYIDEQFCLGVKYDITDRYQLEQRLVASQARAQALLAAFPDGVITMNRAGVFLSVQLPKDFRLKHPPELFVGKHLDDVPLREDSREVIRHYLEQTLTSKQQHTYSYEIVIAGKTCYRDLRFAYLDDDTCLVVVRDVSEWMDMALSLQDVQARFDQFMRVTDDIFAIIDIDKEQFAYINPSYQRLTGYSPKAVFSDMARMGFLQTIDPRDHARMYALRDALKQGRDSMLECRLLCRDGSTRWLLVRCRVVLGGQTAVCVATDISELKRNQDELAANRDQLRNIYDALPDAIARLNAKGEYVSVKMPRYFASIASQQELLGSRIEDTLPADIAATLREHFERTLEHGVMQVCRYDVPHQGNVVSREVRFVRLADGDVLGVYRDISDQRRAELALLQRERDTRKLLDAFPDAIVRLNRAGVYMDVKPASYEPYDDRLPASAMIGKTLEEIAPPELVPLLRECLTQTLETHSPQQFEYQLAKQGRTFYREARFVPLSSDEVLAIIRDVSSERRTEFELTRRKQQLQAIFDTLPYGIARYDREGMCLEHKPARYFETFSPYKDTGLVGKFLAEVAHPDARELALWHFNALLESGQAQVFEYQLSHEDRTIYREATFLLLGDDEVLSVLRDVSDQRRVEQSLIEREQQMRAIFSALPDIIAQFSREGVYVGEIHGGLFEVVVPLEQVQGKTFADMVAMGMLTRTDALALTHALELTFTEQTEHMCRFSLNTDLRTYQREIRFVYLNEAICLGIIRDITAWHEMDTALQNALEHSTALLKEVHHRVRNNLQVLSSVLHLHAASLDDELAKRVLFENRRRIQTLALVHRVLYENESYARIALDQYLESSLGLFAVDMRRQGVVLELDTDNVFVDLDRAIPFGLIVNELVNNALRHAFAGAMYQHGALEPRLQVGLWQQDGTITLQVTDNGVGIPENIITTTNTAQPTLGMVIITSLAEQLHGTFTITRCEDARGTCALLLFAG